MTFECPCRGAVEPDEARALAKLGEIRESCPALRDLLLPDGDWPAFVAWHGTPDEIAAHWSVVLLALRKGSLARITRPLHQYLCPNGSLRGDIRRQYRNDLRERWMFHEDPVKRHQQWRMFHGRLTELLFAAWLEANGRAVTDLEALREGADIETVAADGTRETFELKFIGTEDTDFVAHLQSIAGEGEMMSVSPYAAANYLKFRVYEAACQFAEADLGRTAAIMIDDTTWWRFGIQLKGRWINWDAPTFFTEDEGSNRFLEMQRARYRFLPGDLARRIASLSRIMIMRHSSDLTFETVHEFAQTGGRWHRV